MGASGIPRPDQATTLAFLGALAAESTGAEEWRVSGNTASILREVSSRASGEATAYRLILTCDPKTLQGGMQLAWAPTASEGSLAVTIDGRREVSQRFSGADAKLAKPAVLPANSLKIGGVFPVGVLSEDTVEFPFGDLSQAARQGLAACFPSAGSR